MRDFVKQDTFRTMAIFVLGVVLLAAESARAQSVALPLPPDDQHMITAKLGSIVGKALASKPIEDVSIYFPLQEKTTNYQVTAGPNAGKTQTLGLAKVRRPSGNRPGDLCFRPLWPDSSVRRRRAI